MFSNLINRFVPNVLLPRCYLTEQMIRYPFPKLSNEKIEDWFVLKKMDGRQIATYFDVMDERWGRFLEKRAGDWVRLHCLDSAE